MYNNNFEFIGEDHYVNFQMDQHQLDLGFVNSSSQMLCQNSDDECLNQQEFFSQIRLQKNNNEFQLIPEQRQGKRQQKKKRSEDTIFSSKQNQKNTYINKITSLIQETKPIVASKFERKVSINTDDSIQAKLIRNRECAKNSRKRKKIYLELLENRVNTLKEELDKCKKIIKGHNSYMQQIESNTQLQNYFLCRQQLFEKLEFAVQNNSDKNEVNMLLDQMRLRIGGGNEKIKASNYFLQQIMEMSFPDHVTYLLWASGLNLNETNWFIDLSREINISDLQMKSLKKSYQNIEQDREQLKEIIKQLQNVKENLDQKTNSLENFIDDLRKILTPIQVQRKINFRKNLTFKFWGKILKLSMIQKLKKEIMILCQKRFKFDIYIYLIIIYLKFDLLFDFQLHRQQKKKRSEDTIFSSKQNQKNTYINKITSLIQETKPIVASKFERKVSINTDDSIQAKLIRNRECAKNSRKRKKIYLELLENRVNTLKEELDKCKKIIKGHNSYMQQIESNTQLQNYFLCRQQLFEKLEFAVQNNSDKNEVNMLLDQMRLRIGGGNEKIKASNYFLQQIMEMSFPDHVTYLLWASGLNLNETNWFIDLSREINISDLQMKSLKKSYQNIEQDREQLKEIIKQLQNVKENLDQKTNSLENFIDDLRKILTPIQVAKFLLGLEKNKFQKEFNIQILGKDFEVEYDTEIKEGDYDTVLKKVQI
ncbi:unnamed protein product [Paramecium sonneborni]|uniref:BZIP domain-containing protein n=1 Tax=Paramecium sonneborni TaxID=65129 RepID=A0A8S1RLR7_9CILI|nr:unnamed protein product [Paramecium sonneborni]